MRPVRWTGPAQRSADDFLAYLAERNEKAAGRARRAIEAAATRLTVTPTPGRASLRWAELREISLLRWKKIIVFRVLPDRISVVAFVDARQDLDALKLK